MKVRLPFRTDAVSDAEKRFRGAFDYAPIGMAIVAPDGRWLDVNPALCRLVGYERRDLLGTTRQALTHPEDLPRNLELAERLIAGDIASFEMDKRYIHRQGHSVWVNLSVTSVRHDDGSVNYLIAQIQDISERRRAAEHLQYLADHDTLTGLLNRRGFEQELQRHMQTVRRFGSEGAVLIVDLDRFKYVNDSLGHNAGNELIATAARILKDQLAAADIAARLGGDEFAVLLPRAELAEATRFGERLVTAIKVGLDAAETAGLRVTASIGVAAVETCDDDGEQIMVNADLAMYDAKEAGRDQVSVHAATDRTGLSMKSRVRWIERITRAIHNEQFELHAQPILNVATGEIGHHELLIRMRTDDGDLVPPRAFLDIAERFDLIQDIDRWVIRQAIAIAAAEQQVGAPTVLAVNLSGRSLGCARLLPEIAAELQATAVDPARLVFEITETAAVNDIPAARDLAGRLRDLGCAVALDDFGAGYGTFAYLKHLPFDIIKIDGQFVRGAVTNVTDQVIIDSIVSIATGLGKQTVAEFTGDQATLDLLRDRGVDYAQGFHIGRPLPVDQALRRRRLIAAGY